MKTLLDNLTSILEDVKSLSDNLRGLKKENASGEIPSLHGIYQEFDHCIPELISAVIYYGLINQILDKWFLNGEPFAYTIPLLNSKFKELTGSEYSNLENTISEEIITAVLNLFKQEHPSELKYGEQSFSEFYELICDSCNDIWTSIERNNGKIDENNPRQVNFKQLYNAIQRKLNELNDGEFARNIQAKKDRSIHSIKEVLRPFFFGGLKSLRKRDEIELIQKEISELIRGIFKDKKFTKSLHLRKNVFLKLNNFEFGLEVFKKIEGYVGNIKSGLINEMLEEGLENVPGIQELREFIEHAKLSKHFPVDQNSQIDTQSSNARINESSFIVESCDKIKESIEQLVRRIKGINFFHQFYESVALNEETKEKTSLYFKGEEWSYEKVNREANQLANYFYYGLELNPGMRVGIYMESSANMYITVLACMKAKLVFIPLNVNLPPASIKNDINNYELNAIFSQSSLENFYPFHSLMKKEVLKVVSIDSLLLDPKSLDSFSGLEVPHPCAYRKKDLVYTFPSSGSTGTPKYIEVQHTGLLPCMDASQKELRVSSEDNLAQFAGATFDASVWEFMIAVSSAAQLFIVPNDIRHNPDKLRDFYNNHNITVAAFTPSMLKILEEYNFKTLRTIVSMGEPLHLDIVTKWKSNISGLRFLNGYGPTEATIATSMGEQFNSIHIGKPLKGLEVFILQSKKIDEFGNELDEDEWPTEKLLEEPVKYEVSGRNVGRIYIAGESVAKGYGYRRSINYERISVPSGVDSGYAAIGVTRSEALELMITHLTDVSLLIKPIIYKALSTSEFLKYLNDSSDEPLTLDTIKENIKNYENYLKIARAYINYDIRDKKTNGGQAFPGILQALAQIKKIKLFIWQLDQQNKLTVAAEYHQISSSDAENRIDLLFDNGNHFERLMIKNTEHADELSRAVELTRVNFFHDMPFTVERQNGKKVTCTHVFRTEDIGRYDENGNIEFIGRSDNIFKPGGRLVNPGEIESAIMKYASEKKKPIQYVVVYINDASKISAILLLKNSSYKPDFDDINRYLLDSIESEKIPSLWGSRSFCDTDFTKNGKLSRNNVISNKTPVLSLKEHRSQSAVQVNSEEALTPTEEKLIEIWKKVLEKPDIEFSKKSNFLDFGGKSLEFIRLQVEIHRVFASYHGTSKSIFYKNPTIEFLARRIDRQTAPLKNSPLIDLVKQTVENKKRDPIFLVPGIGGDGELDFDNFKNNFKKKMDSKIPLYTFRARGLNDPNQIGQSIEEIAEDYLEVIKSQKLSIGTYYIACYSSGCTIGYEMACQLQSKGKKAVFIALDGFSPTLKRKLRDKLDNPRTEMASLSDKPYDKFEFTEMLEVLLEKYIIIVGGNISPQRINSIKESLENPENNWEEQVDLVFREIEGSLGDNPSEDKFKKIRFSKSLFMAELQYVPLQTLKKSYLFKVNPQVISLKKSSHQKNYGWKIKNDAHVREIKRGECDHFNFLSEDSVSDVIQYVLHIISKEQMLPNENVKNNPTQRDEGLKNRYGENSQVASVIKKLFGKSEKLNRVTCYPPIEKLLHSAIKEAEKNGEIHTLESSLSKNLYQKFVEKLWNDYGKIFLKSKRFTSKRYEFEEVKKKYNRLMAYIAYQHMQSKTASPSIRESNILRYIEEYYRGLGMSPLEINPRDKLTRLESEFCFLNKKVKEESSYFLYKTKVEFYEFVYPGLCEYFAAFYCSLNLLEQDNAGKKVEAAKLTSKNADLDRNLFNNILESMIISGSLDVKQAFEKNIEQDDELKEEFPSFKKAYEKDLERAGVSNQPALVIDEDSTENHENYSLFYDLIYFIKSNKTLLFVLLLLLFPTAFFFKSFLERDRGIDNKDDGISPRDLNKFSDYGDINYEIDINREMIDYNKTQSFLALLKLPSLSMGDLYEESGDNQKAMDLYNEVINANQNNAYAYVCLGKLYEKLGDNQIAINIDPATNYQNAIDAYKRGINADPNYAYACARLGSLYEKLGDNQAAINIDPTTNYQNAIDA
ncbi:MAG: AMP-binding protein, partial [Proteobacteria bacterium]|nr:AMP-binding protein [Pseudomonadota bacterium]